MPTGEGTRKRAGALRRWRVPLLALAILAAAHAAAALPPVGEVKITASDAQPLDGFGARVAIRGDLAVVGAWWDDDRGTDAGAAYVFRFDGATWAEEAKLTASDGASGDIFGNSVATDGDRVVVGAYFDDPAGAAYVFRFDGAGWVEEAKLTGSDPEIDDRFGDSVGVDGDVLAVGAEYAWDAARTKRGAAYVFRFDGTDWAEEAKLQPADTVANDIFGHRLSLAGDALLVSSWGDDDLGMQSGSAYVFRFDGASWVEEAKLTASDAAERQRFGFSVSLSSEVALIGANPKDLGPGAAYVFRHADGVWVEEARITASDGIAGDRFGIEASLSGNTALVGAVRDNLGRSPFGWGYLYHFDGASWQEVAKLSAWDATEGFGFAVSLDGDHAVFGAWLDDDAGADAGAAYLFSGLAAVPGCRDLADNDGDGRTDHPDDPGCDSPDDPFESSPLLRCDDAVDNDGDGAIDLSDPGCRDPLSAFEDPACSDGINNDPGQDDLVDFDGGQWIWGDCSAGVCPFGVSDPDGDGIADPDPQCASPWDPLETPQLQCGPGGGMLFVIPALVFAYRRARTMR